MFCVLCPFSSSLSEPLALAGKLFRCLPEVWSEERARQVGAGAELSEWGAPPSSTRLEWLTAALPAAALGHPALGPCTVWLRETSFVPPPRGSDR